MADGSVGEKVKETILGIGKVGGRQCTYSGKSCGTLQRRITSRLLKHLYSLFEA